MPEANRPIEELHQEFLAGDLQAGWKLVEIATPAISKSVNRISKKRSDRGDLVNDLSILLIESLANWEPSKLELNQWVGLIASRRLPKQHWKQHGTTRVENESQSKRYEIRESYEDDVESIDESDQVEQVRLAASAVLNDKERRVLQLRSEGIALDNCAAILDSSTTRISNLEQRAIEKVKHALGMDDPMDLAIEQRNELDEHEKTVRSLVEDCLRMAVDAAKAAGIDIRSQVKQLRVEVANAPVNREVLARSLKRHKRELASTV